MTDEFTKYRTTKIVKRAAKGISEMAAEGDERAQSVVEDMKGFLEAMGDSKESLLDFYSDLDDATVLANYESETGMTGKRDVIYALFPDHKYILDSVLELE